MSNGNDSPKPVQRFIYPFALADSSNNDKAQPDAQAKAYFDALSSCQGGHYLLGTNGQWHGGIHFDDGTSGTLDQTRGIRCIADGEIVAWRINERYVKATYPGGTMHQGGTCHYSTGFVLVRHRLQLPEPPQASGDTTHDDHTKSTGDPTATQPSLVFYSLYMHLMDWDGYRKDVHKSRPTYWDGDAVYLVGEKATDTKAKYPENTHIPDGRSKGINLRDTNHHDTCIGFAPQGAKLHLGTRVSSHYYKVEEIDWPSGTSEICKPSNMDNVMVWRQELTALTTPKTKDKVVVLPTPEPVSAGDVIGYVGEYVGYEYRYQQHTETTEAPCKPLLHLEIFTTDNIIDFIHKSRRLDTRLPAGQKHLLQVDKGAQLVQPSAPFADADGTPKTARIKVAPANVSGDGWIKVSAIDVTLSRHQLGAWHSHTHTYASTDATRTALTAQTGLAGSQFAETCHLVHQLHGDKRTIRVHLNQPFWAQADHVDGSGETAMWSDFPLDIANADNPSASHRLVIQTQDQPSAIDASGKHWWQVTIPTDSGDTTGWACESGQTGITLSSRWAWPGFEVLPIDDTKPESLYARHAYLGGNILPDEKTKFAHLGTRAEQGVIFKKLIEIAKVHPGSSGLHDLRGKLTDNIFQGQIANLIANHHSEWAGPDNYWDGINSLIPDESKADWEVEKKRIKKQLWWSKIFNSKTNSPTSLNAIRFLANFIDSECNCSSPIKLSTLNSIAANASANRLAENVGSLNKTYLEYEVNSCAARAHFLAQVLHESGAFLYTKEINGENASYAPWYGRGYIQLTLKANYKSFQNYSGKDVTSSKKNRDKLRKPSLAMLSAGWFYFIKADLMEYSIDDDFIYITYVINGGYNGYNDRLNYLNNFIKSTHHSRCFKKNIDGTYKIQDSQAFNSKKASFAWGLWHDKASKTKGSTKNSTQAIIGYKRYIQLLGSQPPSKIYGIDNPKIFALERITALKG